MVPFFGRFRYVFSLVALNPKDMRQDPRGRRCVGGGVLVSVFVFLWKKGTSICNVFSTVGNLRSPRRGFSVQPPEGTESREVASVSVVIDDTLRDILQLGAAGCGDQSGHLMNLSSVLSYMYWKECAQKKYLRIC